MKNQIAVLIALSSAFMLHSCSTCPLVDEHKVLVQKDLVGFNRSNAEEIGGAFLSLAGVEVVVFPLMKRKLSGDEVKTMRRLTGDYSQTSFQVWQPSPHEVERLFHLIVDPKTKRGKVIRKQSSGLICQVVGTSYENRAAILFNFCPVRWDENRNSAYVSLLSRSDSRWPDAFSVVVFVDSHEMIWPNLLISSEKEKSDNP